MISPRQVARTPHQRRGVADAPIAPVSVATTSMGGRLVVHLAAGSDEERARRDAHRVLARVDRWADRLSRHRASSELSALNAAAGLEVTVGPTLGAALQAGLVAADLSGGLVDIALLDARLAAEGLLAGASRPAPTRSWSLSVGPGRRVEVRREPGIRFDLGGVAKGWLADRALALLSRWPSAVVDADGDLAVRCAPGQVWAVAVDDPRSDGASLAVLQLSAACDSWPTRWGVATSGTSVHRWRRGGEVRHHLIDPRSGAPAVTDVVQATVLCRSALHAEALAKTAVIAGSIEGLALLERAGVAGAVLLTERGEVLALPSTLSVLAA